MLVRAVEPFMTDVDGNPVVVSPDDVFEDTAPIVRMYPSLFRPVASTRSTVEQMTAAPGEMRSGVRRPR